MHVLNILWVVFGIGLMLVLNLKFKINSMVALLVAALSVGMLAGMDLMSLLHTMKAGFGNTLGELAIIVVFGAVIGKLMVDSGAAHQIAHTLLARLGLRYVQLSVIIIGLIFGLAMFYEVAFIMLAPLVIVIAAEAKIPFLKLAIPAVAAATTAHSLFPPQPGPVALVNAYGADMGMVYIGGYRLDTDVAYLDFPTIMQTKGLNGYSKEEIPTDPGDDNNGNTATCEEQLAAKDAKIKKLEAENTTLKEEIAKLQQTEASPDPLKDYQVFTAPSDDNYYLYLKTGDQVYFKELDQE